MAKHMHLTLDDRYQNFQIDELIRYFLPKGKPFDYYTQEDISYMMDNI